MEGVMKPKEKRLLTKVYVCLTIAIFTIGAGAGLCYAADPARLPKTVGIGTHAIGGAYHASGTAVAALISEKTPIRAVVRPSAGPNAWMSLMQSGELEMGLLSSFDAACAYLGSYGYDNPNPAFRVLLRANVAQSTTLTVLKRSGIKKITDLRGKRVAYKYGGNVMLHNLTLAMLRSVGMTLKDVVPVPVPEYKTSIRMIRERRIAAGTSGATTTPAARELHTALGVNVLAYGDIQPADIAQGVPGDKQAILDELVPGTFPAVAKAGIGIIEKDTVLISYAIYFAASTYLSKDAVYLILKTVWENYADLHPAHPWLRGWKSETMPVSGQPAPYHDGAVKFYKEKGVWTKEMEKRQVKLLKHK